MDITAALITQGFEEVSYKDFYRDIFPQGSFEAQGVYEDGKYNGIVIELTNEKKNDGSQRVLRHTVTDELGKIDEIVSRNNFCLMSPISYAGKSRKSENARFIYAIAIDVDGITSQKCFNVLMKQAEKGEQLRAFVWGIPKPTYFVSSGSGVHIYYVFEKPVPLFPNIVKELEKLKRRLTWQAWTQGATTLVDSVQYESLFQGFRVVGTITKDGKRARAFRYGEGKKVTVEYLNFFVPAEFQAQDFTYKSDLTLAQAKKKYPEWYDKRVIKKMPKGSWQCHKGLYDWWIGKVLGGAQQGHRYWCVMTLAVYAKKCGISYDKLVHDAIDLIPFLNSVGAGTDEFTVDDVMHAVESYNDSYMTYPISTIEERTDIKIERNKRNGRKQEQHLQLARGIRQLKMSMGELVTGGGRPSCGYMVLSWRDKNPEGTKAECMRATGLSKPTVYKWWDNLLEFRAQLEAIEDYRNTKKE